MLEHTLASLDEPQMLQFAATLAASTHAGMIIYLEGDLGAGKTTFARGFIQALGHQGAVKSPTYTIVEPYDLPVPVFHFDLYRLADPEELEYMGGRDYFSPESISLVEWAVCGKGFIPEPDIVIAFEREQQNARKLSLRAHSASAEKLLSALA